MSSTISTGDMLRELRVKNGLTQQAASMAMGVNVRTYRRWENNESCIHVDDFIKILNIFGMRLDVIRTKDDCKKEDGPGWYKRNY